MDVKHLVEAVLPDLPIEDWQKRLRKAILEADDAIHRKPVWRGEYPKLSGYRPEQQVFVDETAFLSEAGLAGAAAGKSFAERFDTGEVVGRIVGERVTLANHKQVQSWQALNEENLEALVDASFRATKVRLFIKALAGVLSEDEAWQEEQYRAWRAKIIQEETSE